MTFVPHEIPSSQIVRDASKKHYLQSSVTMTLPGEYFSQTDLDPLLRLYFVEGGKMGQYVFNNPGVMETITIPGWSPEEIEGLVISAECYYFKNGAKNYMNIFWNEYGPSLPYCKLNDPTLTILYSGTKATPVAASSVTGGFINPADSKEIQFSTEYISNIDEQYTVKSGTFYYKESDALSYTSIAFTGDTVTIPANTLAFSKTYDAYAELVLDDDSTCTYTFSAITTTDGTPAVSPVSPSNVVVYGETRFKWEYNNEYGTNQYAYDVQLSTDDGANWTTILNHVVSSESETEVYSGISAGKILWRVRAYNNSDEPSAWSTPLSFICNIPPNPPVITEVIPGGRITVKWTANGQTAYRLMIKKTTGETVYDSGDVYTIVTQCFANYYLPDGSYMIFVRITNAIGKESDFASISYTQAQEITAPIVQADYTESTNVVDISIQNESLYEKYYLIRNGEVVAEFTQPTYMDHFAAGVTNYELIAVNASDKFGMATFSVDATSDKIRLIRKDFSIINASIRWNALSETTEATNTRYEAIEYLGASVPEHAFSKMRTKRIQFAFEDKDGIACDLLGEVLFYSGTHGIGCWAVPVSVSRSDNWLGDETVLGLEMTNGKEAIQYDQ